MKHNEIHIEVYFFPSTTTSGGYGNFVCLPIHYA